MIRDSVTPTGKLLIELRDEFGNLKHSSVVSNLVVTSGKSLIASRLAGNADDVMSHMAVGIIPTNPLIENFELGEEVARVSLSSSVIDNEITYVATFAQDVPDTNLDLVEAGIFNANVSGLMLSRVSFPIVPKLIADTLTITWKITIN